MMIDVIIPVYRGISDLKKCMQGVLQTKGAFQVVLIDDASPEEDLAAYLDELNHAYESINLIRNKSNLGFVASVNKGISLHKDRDVVLLNSDTIVANEWLDRLYNCAYKESRIGTVTPFSNNATICSFPHVCRENKLPVGWSCGAIDRIFEETNHGQCVEIPTAVGFCMYIKRSCINDVGLLDVNGFGLGYGEENDFCMRAAKRGWRHVLCADTFVFHKGSVSFGDEKQKRLSSAMKKLDEIYPDYHGLIHDHIDQNPARPFRTKALVEMIRQSDRKKVLHVNHNLGGGTEKHIQELAVYLAKQMDAVVLRPINNHKIALYLGPEMDAESLAFLLPSEYEELVKICKYLNVTRLHFHHTMGIETSVWGLAKDIGVPFDITLHDYYFINANPTLSDENGKFCADCDTRDMVCQKAYPIPGDVSAEKWRDNQKKLIEGADRIFAPSLSTVSIYKRYFECANYCVAFHPDWEKDGPYPGIMMPSCTPSTDLRILTIGALSKEKGADILEACANLSNRKKMPFEFHLVGYAYRPLDSAVIEHGPYEDEDLDSIITDLRPHIVWFAATWPETYSYTLSAALKAGLPVAAYDIGAFHERLTDRPLTWIKPLNTNPEEWIQFFCQIKDALIRASCENQTMKWTAQPLCGHTHFTYKKDYMASVVGCKTDLDFSPSIRWIKTYLNQLELDNNGNSLLSRRERLLVYLLKLRQKRAVSSILSIVPYRMQRGLKRLLSRRPVHEFLLRKSI